MMPSNLVPIIFYLTLFLFFYMGIQIYSMDTKDRVHRAFFGVCMSMSTWALTFSLMSHAETLEQAYPWGIISVFGWGSVYSILLHLLLLLTRPERRLKLIHWFMIYLPVALNLYLYGYRGYLGNLEIVLLPGGYWTSRATTLYVWEIWVNLYYLLNMGLSCYLLMRWGKESGRSERRKISLLKAALLFSLLLYVSRIFGLDRLLGGSLLEWGPLHMLPFTLTLMMILKRRALDSGEHMVTLPQRGAFLSRKTNEKVFLFVSQAYILAAFLVFGIEVFLKGKDLKETGILSVSMFIMGFVIFMVLKSGLRLRLRDNILNTIMTLTIPYVSFYMAESTATFGWTVPVIFILIAVAFNNTKLLTSTGVLTLTTLAVLWKLKPDQLVVFTPVDHFSRMMIFLIILFVAYYINSIYKNRLNQFERQVDHERFVSEMAVLLSMARNKNLRSNLDVFLERCVRYMDADYGSIHVFPDQGKGKLKKFECYGRYDLKGIRENWNFGKNLDLVLEDNLKSDYYEGELMGILEDFGQSMVKKGVSTMTVPLEESGKVLGVMCIGVSDKSSWDEGYYNSFKLIGNSLSGMLYKIKKEDELYHMAFYDHLTGLPNRVLYNKIVTKLIRETKEDEMLALLFLDLDDFKNINDLLGHSVGDDLLVEFVRRLKPLLKGERYMSRFGGDEFLLVIPHVRDHEEIGEYAKEILKTIMQPFHFDDREVNTGASVGISVYPRDGKGTEELIRFADLAMYSSKTSGKNKFTICTEDIKAKFIFEKELEDDLRKALKQNELELYYQPKVHGVTEEIIGVEALIRWNHPEKGILNPGEFLPIAERTGVLAAIDNWVFMEACEQNRRWQEDGLRKINMSINVTPSSFMQPDLATGIETIFSRRNWDPSFVEIEITENNMYFSLDSIKRKLSGLREMGVTVALDDFGTAYSSLSRLHDLPIDKVKIDRQFVMNITRESRGRSLYDGILDLSKSLDLIVTVEGVETREQSDYVREKGCDEIQGFYYYRPMKAEEVEKLLRKEGNEKMLS